MRVPKGIEKLDRNFAVSTGNLAGMDVFSADSEKMELGGFYWRKRGGAFWRLPEEMDLSFSEGVRLLSRHTAGGCLRFRSNASKISLHAVVRGGLMCHMTQVGSHGFDLYAGREGEREVFVRCATFPALQEDRGEYTAVLFDCADGCLRDFTIYFPLYAAVEALEIGFSPGAEVLPPVPWRDARPVVVYGTSITQGGCVSRPGMLYTNILSRLLRRPVLNFGFSGNGKGEPEVARKLAEIADPAMYILDYDYNAGPELLAETLENFIRILRNSHPETPILALSGEPRARESTAVYLPEYASRERERFHAIHQGVWEKLRAEGDENLHFIDGRKLYGEDFEECTVDGTHLTDLGSYRIAGELSSLAGEFFR